MPGSPDAGGLETISTGVLRPLGKENANTPNVSMRKSDRKLKSSSACFKVFQDEGATRNGEQKPSSSPEFLDALKLAESEVKKYKDELQQTQESLKARHERVQELKAASASMGQRYTTLLRSHDEAKKELELLRSMAENSELLREERNTLELKLANRESSLSSIKQEVAAGAERESSLRAELERVRRELEGASDGIRDRSETTSVESESRWPLEKAALDAQIRELDEQLTVSQRRCSAIAAERAVLAEEATRREKEHNAKVTALQDELNSLQRRTSADLGDWQRRHREAFGAKKAVEAQLERLVTASNSINILVDKQVILETSLQEARELLSQTLPLRSPSVTAGENPGSAERVVEGILEHVLGRVFEATEVWEDAEGGLGDEEEHSLIEKGLILRGKAFDKLTVNMENLKAYGVKEAEAYLDQARTLEVKLEDLRQRHDALLSEKEDARTQSQQEVERLTQRLSEVDKEHNDTKARLESTQQELTTTVQLSELALAAKGCTGEGGRSEDENGRFAAAQQRVEELEAQIHETQEKLESERRASTEKVDALTEEKRELLDKVKELSAQASALMDKAASREADNISPVGRSSPGSGVSAEEFAARENMLKELKSRLFALVAENKKLGEKVKAASNQPNSESQIRIKELEAQVIQLKEHLSAERERVKNAEEDDRRMRKYVLRYNARSEQKMKEMQKRLEMAMARPIKDA